MLFSKKSHFYSRYCIWDQKYLVFYHLLTVTNWTTKNCMSHSVVKEQLRQFAVHHLFSCAVLIGPWWRIPEKERFCRAVHTTYKRNLCGKGCIFYYFYLAKCIKCCYLLMLCAIWISEIQMLLICLFFFSTELYENDPQPTA